MKGPETGLSVAFRCRAFPARPKRKRGGLVRELPAHPLARAVAQEPDDAMVVFTVQPPDGIVQAAFGRLVGPGWNRIVDSTRPALFLERRQHGS